MASLIIQDNPKILFKKELMDIVLNKCSPHLMQKVDSLEKTLMLGGIGGRRKRG